MYAPSAYGGIAKYANGLLSAMVTSPVAATGLDIALVTARDLRPEFQSDAYPVMSILPPLKERDRFRTGLGWAFSRVFHYAIRDFTFIIWLRRHPTINIVHIQEFTGWLMPIVILLIRQMPRRVVMTVHNLTPPRKNAWTQLNSRMMAFAWRRCDALIVHSLGQREALESRLNKRAPPIVVVPHGIWAVNHTMPSANDVTRLLFFGTILRYKGVDTVLDALVELPTFSLDVVGKPADGRYAEHVARRAQQFAVGRVRIDFRYVPESEIERLFRRAGIVVLPYSYFDSQSGVLNLAVAHHVPVVVSDVGAMGETVAREGVGLVVPSGDSHQLAEAIRKLSEPDTYRRAVAACVRTSATLSWATASAATLSIYRTLVRDQ